MANPEFKAGDIVKAKSGGPIMTIESVIDDIAICVWFDKEQLCYANRLIVDLEPSSLDALALQAGEHKLS